MLIYLYILEQYFECSFGAAYERELLQRFGASAVQDAVDKSLIEKCILPNSISSNDDLLCRLTDKGRQFCHQRSAVF